MQRQQALDQWHDQLACHAHSLEQQKQSWDQQQIAWNADMNSSVADQLQRQTVELDQKYLPVIKALEQQLKCTHQTAAQQADKAAQELQQKQQEFWCPCVCSAGCPSEAAAEGARVEECLCKRPAEC